MLNFTVRKKQQPETEPSTLLKLYRNGYLNVKNASGSDEDATLKSLLNIEQNGESYRLQVDEIDFIDGGVEFTYDQPNGDTSYFFMKVGDLEPLDGFDVYVNYIDHKRKSVELGLIAPKSVQFKRADIKKVL